MAKLMLVEDDNNLREIYEARLQAEGYTIVSAKDGEEALVVAKAEKPDLIISDVMMPKISGFEMLDILRNTDGLKDVKVIMLTALGQSDDQQRADKLGADRYLVKSQVTLEDIVKVTHELLDDQTANSAPSPAPAAAPAAEPSTPPPAAPAAASEPVTTPAPEPPAPPATPDPLPVATPPEPPQPSAVAAPEPTVIPVVAEPPAPAAPQAATADSNSGSADANEPSDSADLGEKIEDFVAGATEEASTPAEAATQDAVASVPAAPIAPPAAAGQVATSAPDKEQTPPSTSTVAEPSNEEKGAADSAAAENVAADDKLMKNAVEALVQSAQDEDVVDDTASGAPIPPASAAPAEEKETETKEEAEVDEEDVPSSNNHVAIAHKKVIEPLNSAPKDDIEKLLAIEEAKEAVQSAEKPVVMGDNEPKPDGSSDGKVDPHSIAL